MNCAGSLLIASKMEPNLSPWVDQAMATDMTTTELIRPMRTCDVSDRPGRKCLAMSTATSVPGAVDRGGDRAHQRREQRRGHDADEPGRQQLGDQCRQGVRRLVDDVPEQHVGQHPRQDHEERGQEFEQGGEQRAVLRVAQGARRPAPAERSSGRCTSTRGRGWGSPAGSRFQIEPGSKPLFSGKVDHAELVRLRGREQVLVGVDSHFGQPGHGDDRDQDGAAQQDDGLDRLRDDDCPQTADDGVDHRDDRDHRDRHERRNPEEPLEHGGAGVEADADVDQHRRHDEHDGQRGPGGRAVAPLHELGQRRDPGS